MTRSLAALACCAALFGAPAQSDAGIIPWMYDSVFGYGPSGGGGYGHQNSGRGWRSRADLFGRQGRGEEETRIIPR